MTRAVVANILSWALLAAVARADEASTTTCHLASPDTKIRVTFQPQTPVQDLATWVMGFTCKNVVFDGAVATRATKVSILSPREMTPTQAVQLFVDAMDAVGLVVTQRPDTLVVKLGPGMPKSCPDVADSSPPAAVSPQLAQDDSDALDKIMDAGIHLRDHTHAEITRDPFDRVLADPAAFSRGARIVPAVKDGKSQGFRLYAFRPRSLFGRLGFQNGDTLVTINGFELTSVEKALEIYTKLREATLLEVEILRAGKPLTVTIVVK
jgi:hypothetical protein